MLFNGHVFPAIYCQLSLIELIKIHICAYMARRGFTTLVRLALPVVNGSFSVSYFPQPVQFALRFVCAPVYHTFLHVQLVKSKYFY